MKTQKWNPKTREYQDYELPEGACLYSDDMDKEIACAQCGQRMLFGDGYTSRQIHNKYGFGYAVCERCYEKEREEEQEMEDDKNIIKKVFIITTDNDQWYIYMSLETLNKIKRGEYEYRFIQYTDGMRNYYYKLDLISFMSTENDQSISVDELENEMRLYIEKREPCPFNVMVDDNTGF